MRYHDITYDDMKNGDGLRVVLWVSGCEHCCKDCQNPVTWDENGGLLFDDKAKQELFDYINHNHISGLTLSGGDPLFMHNREAVLCLCEDFRLNFPDKNIWLYTGYDWNDIKHLSVLKYIDVCIDGKYDCNLRDVKLKWRGSSNQRVIDVKKSLVLDEVVLYCD